MSNRISENAQIMRAIVALDQAQFEVFKIEWHTNGEMEIVAKPKTNGSTATLKFEDPT